MIDLIGYEINNDSVFLRIIRGNKEEVITCQVGAFFFEQFGKEEGLNMLFGLCE